ncbi:VPLPA-CTERM sorting domain-containing protein [Oceanicoccus sp. KOV_DT_Chl]|uniref:VPLPA-CTERM sorting domain-containing protein n=1 Tax=Oceanicoccus sp. KOV_DT_Chl TaxID=1904639 RepID=UPI00190EDCFE|nr:VPLPA-CTERM sorting domain-containing protein [Oceanicoccus sp. KOV_DT_Chl]
MKKLFALSMAIAAASSGANAALQLGSTSNNEAGELFITMWNNDNQTSFVQDLNLYVSDLLYGTGVISDGQTLSINQTALDALGAGDIKWTINGANTDKTTNEFDRDLFPANQWRNNAGLLLTANREITATDEGQINTNIDNAYQSLQTKLNASDNSITDVYQLTGIDFFGEASWGEGMYAMANTFNFDTAAGVNDGTMDFYGLQLFDDRYDMVGDGTGFGDDLWHVVNFGSWTLAGNELTYNAPVAAVPVPAAAWLFGSALLGLAGIGRKRKTHS